MPSWYFGLFVALERQPRRKLKGFPVPEDYRAALGPDSRSSSFATYKSEAGVIFYTVDELQNIGGKVCSKAATCPALVVTGQMLLAVEDRKVSLRELGWGP